jgi:2-dehydropantoate 2-reductase
MEIKKVSIIGLGALGILFGDHLAKRMNREDLRIVADQDRVQRYKKDGVYCNGKFCDFNYVTPEDETTPADLLLFTVKYGGLKEAIKTVESQVGENTLIVSALNGITSEEVIGQAFGLEKVVYCVSQGMDAVKVENKLTYQRTGLLCIGDKEPGTISEKVKRIARFFDQVDLPYEIDTNMVKRQWGKFMLNVGLNQTVAVYGETYEDTQKEGFARETMIAAMREVISLSQKAGVNLSEEDLNYWLNVLATITPSGKPSMRQDVEAKRFSEVEIFAGTALELGKKYNVPTPVNQLLYDKIKAIESQY